jgi:very-short-patch-repair endonuclease
VILAYESRLKSVATRLRREMTDAEKRLWHFLRRDQICGARFYRQRPIGHYIVDFYCPRAKIVVEVDGGQHYSDEGSRADVRRDEFLRRQGLEVLRFDNGQVLTSAQAVAEEIARRVAERITQS